MNAKNGLRCPMLYRNGRYSVTALQNHKNIEEGELPF